MSSHCPVCHVECKHIVGYEDYYLTEETEDCPNDCYHYEFSYGNYQVYVLIQGHHIPIYWSYLDDSRSMQNAIDILVSSAQSFRVNKDENS